MNNIYLALDFPSWGETKQFIETNELKGVPVKVGMELFYREGPLVVEKLKEDNHPIFLDLKLHDIPTTVRKAMKNIAGLGIDIVNVHALGGSGMISAAKEGLISGEATDHKTKLIAVTILTSMDSETMHHELLLPGDLDKNAVHFAQLAENSGADGVVCSVHEAKAIREICGPDFLKVTPGIRFANSQADDQKRVATPEVARLEGSTHIVVGRAITKATDPVAAYRAVKAQWEGIE